MAEYIERDKAIDACFDGWNNNAHDCADNIRSIPAADARPVVRGRWKKELRANGWNEWYDCTCSQCGALFRDFDPSNFCPNCGARMEES